jgi:hypothetical protein
MPDDAAVSDNGRSVENIDRTAPADEELTPAPRDLNASSAPDRHIVIKPYFEGLD